MEANNEMSNDANDMGLNGLSRASKALDDFMNATTPSTGFKKAVKEHTNTFFTGLCTVAGYGIGIGASILFTVWGYASIKDSFENRRYR